MTEFLEDMRHDLHVALFVFDDTADIVHIEELLLSCARTNGIA